jgi:hypothetical protein
VITVARPSGVVVPFEPPELTMEQAIRRGWEMDDDDVLMVPKREEFLPTYPLPSGLAAAWVREISSSPFVRNS